MWSQAAPTLRNLTIDSDQDSVTGTWTFDRPGALIPSAATLAPLGGYPLKAMSPSRPLSFDLDKTPIEVCAGNELKIRFPIRRVPTGRGITLGAELSEPIGTVSPLDMPSVVELALETLTATRDAQTRKSADQAISEYLSQATYAKEPWTNQLLPFAEDGTGIDLASAHALLMQAVTTSTQTTSEANSLLTSVVLRRDWLTWTPWVEDSARRRRAAALAALAGSMCPEPERRLAAAMLQAGLSAERGLNLWRLHRKLISHEPPLLEAMPGVRQGVYHLAGAPIPESRFVDSLVSPVRIYGEVPIRVTDKDKTLTMEWLAIEPKASILRFASAYELKLEPLANLPRFHPDVALGTVELLYTPETTGLCSARLTLPAWAKPLPKSVPTPRYTESNR